MTPDSSLDNLLAEQSPNFLGITIISAGISHNWANFQFTSSQDCTRLGTFGLFAQASPLIITYGKNINKNDLIAAGTLEDEKHGKKYCLP